MATLAALRAAVDARLAVLWPKIKTREEAYRAAKGHYYQGILWSSLPDDGALVAPTLTRAPTDQYDYTPPVRDAQGVITVPEVKAFHDWTYFANGDIPANIEMAIRIDTYQAPGGVHGYYCTCLVTKEGVTYGRTAQVEAGTEITTGAWEIV